MNVTTSDQRAKRLLSPESVNLTTLDKLDKRIRHDSLEIEEDYSNTTEKTLTMELNKVPECDLKTWMAGISGQLSETVNKNDLVNLATKKDLENMMGR